MVSRKPFIGATTGHDASSSSSSTHPTPVENPSATTAAQSEKVKQLIRDLSADLSDLEQFYNVKVSLVRNQKIGEYLVQRRNKLVVGFQFDQFDQQGKVDWLLVYRYTIRRNQQLLRERENIERTNELLGDWVQHLAQLCEKRQKVSPTHGKDAAQVLQTATDRIDLLLRRLAKKASDAVGPDRFAAFRAAGQLEQLHTCLGEWFNFYKDYDPVFTWWTSKPQEELSQRIDRIISFLREHIVGIAPGDEDAIVGLPIGEAGITQELQAELIPYTPEELINIGERQFQWCEEQAIKASRELGFGDDWRRAMDHIKNRTVEPGKQTQLVHELADEAVEYVTKHDLVTVPEIASTTWRTFMMTPKDQKVAPYFLGGESIYVSYPTSTMSHQDKLMIMRANCRPMSRSTVFHELIPGHHLQTYYMQRHRTYRQLFYNPFWMEGWAFYWELILWDRGFPDTPANRLGMLFWHMHRCARIVFSLKFHLGQMSPQECVEYLVEKVGHERATAEGEVRRSFNGDYDPLYQAAYMLGALQIYALRKEIVDTGIMGEKEFHDRVLKENAMPIEMLRALLKNEPLERNHKASWRFYPL